jgi:uncharacterized protein
MSRLFSRIAGWSRHLPTREQMERNRLVAPLARRHELWRFTRRSVPRGVAVGLFVGIFALIPGVQIVGAALMCVPARGNIPLAALLTCVSIPPTTLFVILPLAVSIGNRFGFHADIDTVRQMMARGASLNDWWSWVLSDTAPSIIIGLFIQSVVAAVLGYVISSFFWNRWVMHKRRLRQAELRRLAEGQ